MKIIVVGKTDGILALNKSGVPVRGKEQAVIEIDSEEKKNEIIALKKAGLLDILEVNASENKKNTEIVIPVSPTPSSQNLPEETGAPPEVLTLTPSSSQKLPEEISAPPKTKKKSGRPKGSKNKKNAENKVEKKTEQQRVDEAEARTQKMGSRVVIGTGNGTVETKMKNSFEGKVEESEATKDSLKAMEDIENTEAENKKTGDTKIDESTMDPSEQMGRQATVVSEGEQKKSPMAKSIIPEQEKMRENDPFIDNKNDAKDSSRDAFIDQIDNDDDSFLKI